MTMKDTTHNRTFIYSEIYPPEKRMTPKNIRIHFWDFYALELLFSKIEEDNNFLKKEKIEDMLRETATSLLNQQVMALEASIRGEVRHFINACKTKYGKNKACVVSFDLQKVYCKEDPLKMDLEIIKSIFEKTIWDSAYGGKSWAKATQILIEAKKALLEYNFRVREIVYFVDRIFDIHHNNGFILNKTAFKTLDDGTLNCRKDIISLKTFLSNVLSNDYFRSRYNLRIPLSLEVRNEIERYLNINLTPAKQRDKVSA